MDMDMDTDRERDMDRDKNIDKDMCFLCNIKIESSAILFLPVSPENM
jgi:hypothetical protein